jgi:hypothetical protein
MIEEVYREKSMLYNKEANERIAIIKEDVFQ